MTDKARPPEQKKGGPHEGGSGEASPNGVVQAESRPWSRRFIEKFSLVSVVLLFCFGAGEIVTRLVLKQQTPLFPRYHTGAEYGE